MAQAYIGRGMKIAILAKTSGRPDETFSIVAEAMARRIDAAGDRPVMIMPGGKERRSPQSFHGFPCYFAGRMGSVLHYPLAVLHLERMRRRERPDLIHLHFAGADTFGLALFLLFRKIPVVLTFHAFNAGRLRSFGRRYPIFLKILLRRSSRLTVVSRPVGLALESAFPEAGGRWDVVPNGVPVRPPVEDAGERSGDSYLLTAGDLCFEKGTDLLLMAMAELRRPVRLVICGRDLTGGRIPNLIAKLGLKSRVEWLGPVPQARVHDLMRRCLFYVCPSREESFGLAVLEAMACGKAAVAPALESLRGYLQDGIEAVLFKPGSAADLARGIEKLLSHGPLREDMEIRAARLARRFDWEGPYRRYAEIYAAAST